MGSIIKRNKAVARKKGTLAATATAGSVLTIALVSPVLGIVGLAGSAYLALDWFKFRAKNGMKF